MTTKDEDDIPALSLSLGQQLRVDQSTLQNVDVKPPTEENTGKWEIDPMSSFVELIAEESDEQCVYEDDKEKDVDVPSSNLSRKQVLDVVIQFKICETHKDENHLQLVLELENLTKRKIVEQSYNQMQLTLDSISQNILVIQTENLEIPC